MNWEGFLDKAKQHHNSTHFVNNHLNVPWFMTISKQFFPLDHHIIADYLKIGIPTSYVNNFKQFPPPTQKAWKSKKIKLSNPDITNIKEDSSLSDDVINDPNFIKIIDPTPYEMSISANRFIISQEYFDELELKLSEKTRIIDDFRRLNIEIREQYKFKPKIQLKTTVNIVNDFSEISFGTAYPHISIKDFVPIIVSIF